MSQNKFSMYVYELAAPENAQLETFTTWEARATRVTEILQLPGWHYRQYHPLSYH